MIFNTGLHDDLEQFPLSEPRFKNMASSHQRCKSLQSQVISSLTLSINLEIPNSRIEGIYA